MLCWLLRILSDLRQVVAGRHYTSENGGLRKIFESDSLYLRISCISVAHASAFLHISFITLAVCRAVCLLPDLFCTPYSQVGTTGSAFAVVSSLFHRSARNLVAGSESTTPEISHQERLIWWSRLISSLFHLLLIDHRFLCVTTSHDGTFEDNCTESEQ